MKFKPVKLAPVLITVCVIALVCLVRVLHLEFVEGLERMTYDQRVRTALRFPQPVATNLGAVLISDDSIKVLTNSLLGFSYGLNWPRHIYGRMLREASVQGARAVAFDVLFGELHQFDASVPVAGERRREAIEFLRLVYPEQEPATVTQGNEELALVESDDYFAWQLKRSGIAMLAAEQGVPPFPLFATNALALGDISADPDPGGVLRRALAFRDYRSWDSNLVAIVAGSDVDLTKARVRGDQIQFFTGLDKPALDGDGNPISIKLNSAGEFDLREHITGQLPPGYAAWRKPFTVQRVWHMGIVLASQQLGLDLANAQVDLKRGRITLRGNNGLQRVLPVDADGYFDINWELTASDARLTKAPFEELLNQDSLRSSGVTNDLSNKLENKLLVVGSSALGNNLTDRGATPLEKSTLLVSKHWNVANSLITGRFVHRASPATEFFIIALLGALTAILTWQLRVLTAAGSVILLALAYIGAAFYLYIQHRYWLPMVLPIVGVMLVEHVSLVTYRVVFEQAERRRLKSLFSQVVSPNIVNVLLDLEKLSLSGERREITVFFADVRGFTELTDKTQEEAEQFVRQHNLTGEAAEAYFDERAAETLNTVNLYLALVADMVKKHDGTLDKYIGDCVMAFWGAPTANEQHALACVRAAIDAQRAMHELNQRRTEESRKREIENRARESAGLPPKSLLPSLALGTGINTGTVTVGLMGSEAHIRNYTVFGREVNLASRLEGVSGRGRIVIGETTYQHLLRDDPALAARCIELEPAKPKGFQRPVRIYEVPWLPPGASKDSSGITTTFAKTPP